MPELPDVEVFRRYLDATSLHQTIRSINLPDERILHNVSRQALAKRLDGRSLEQTRRHGKHLGAETLDSGWLMLHFGMTGFLDYARESEPPQGTRLVLHFESGYRLAYSNQRLLGHVGWADDFDAFVKDRELGPDALALAQNPDAFAALVEEARGGVKSLLMNQGRLAGVGNVYSDETLFHARLHPDTPVDALSEEQVETLRKSLLMVLEVAIERKADPEQVPGDWLLPRREEGSTCPRCAGPIRSDEVTGRTSWFCPTCQPPPG